MSDIVDRMVALLMRSRLVTSSLRSAHFLSQIPLELRGGQKISPDFFNNQSFYEDVKKEKDQLALQVVWVSRDRTKEDLLAYYEKKLPAWPYIPFGSPYIAQYLKHYDIKTIPAVRLVNNKGEVVRDDIRMPIERSKEGEAAKLVRDWIAEVQKSEK